MSGIRPRVRSGLDILVSERAKRLDGLRVAVLANQSTCDFAYVHLVDRLKEFNNCTLMRIFAPEHGFRGEQQDMAYVGDAVDLKTGVPVTSLYGKTEASLRPTVQQLKDVDLLIADLPDIGTRYYTFAQTLGYCMEVAAKAGIPVLVLDRPNPINGTDIEGPNLLTSCRSFCGYAPVPVRHGLTLGELATLMNEGTKDAAAVDSIPAIGCKLEVLKAEGWRRAQYFDETDLPWIIPSPNMPRLETAIVYPGACLIEATTLSEARGTTMPFEFVGSPEIDTEQLLGALSESEIPLSGVSFRPITFLPQFQKHAGKLCFGLQAHVTDRRSFRPFRCTLALLFALRKSQPKTLEWRTGVYEFIEKVPAIDLLFGSSELRDALESNSGPASLLARLEAYETNYLRWRQPYLLYP